MAFSLEFRIYAARFGEAAEPPKGGTPNEGSVKMCPMNSGSAAINEAVNFPVGQRFRAFVGQMMKAVKRVIGRDAIFRLQRENAGELVPAISERHTHPARQRPHE